MARASTKNFVLMTDFRVGQGNMTVFIRRDGELFTSEYKSLGGLASGHYVETCLGYWPELADQMWAKYPAAQVLGVCETCGRSG